MAKAKALQFAVIYGSEAEPMESTGIETWCSRDAGADEEGENAKWSVDGRCGRGLEEGSGETTASGVERGEPRCSEDAGPAGGGHETQRKSKEGLHRGRTYWTKKIRRRGRVVPEDSEQRLLIEKHEGEEDFQMLIDCSLRFLFISSASVGKTEPRWLT